jgi:hypothetical protein
MDEFERAAAAFPDLDDTFSPGIPQSTGLGATNFPALDDDFGAPTTATLSTATDDADPLDEFQRAASAFPALDVVDGPAHAPSLEVRESMGDLWMDD